MRPNTIEAAWTCPSSIVEIAICDLLFAACDLLRCRQRAPDSNIQTRQGNQSDYELWYLWLILYTRFWMSLVLILSFFSWWTFWFVSQGTAKSCLHLSIVKHLSTYKTIRKLTATMHSLTFVISWLLAALLGTVRQKAMLQFRSAWFSKFYYCSAVIIAGIFFAWTRSLLKDSVADQGDVTVAIQRNIRNIGRMQKKSDIDISWNVAVEVHHLAERCRRLEGSSGEVQPQPRFYCSTCSRTLQLDYVIIIIIFFFGFSLIFDLKWLPMTLVLCSFWSLRLFPIAGSIFEAGFGAVSGGAAQAATLEPSTSGELQVKCRFVCHEVQEVLWQLFQVACLESCFEC